MKAAYKVDGLAAIAKFKFTDRGLSGGISNQHTRSLGID
jgi:hypothetical protein